MQEIVHPLQNLPFHFALSLPCMCFVFPGVYTAQSTGDRPVGGWPGGLGQSLLIPTEGCLRQLDYCKWCFGSVASSFLYLLWYRFPLLALGFPNCGHRDSVWTRVTSKALILPRVCWSLNSFPWPEGPAGSQQSLSILHLHPQLRPSHLAYMALAMLLFFILCWTLSGLWTSVLSCLFLLSQMPFPMAHILLVSVKYQLLGEAAADHPTSRDNFPFNPPLHTLLPFSLRALNKPHRDPICLLSYFCLWGQDISFRRTRTLLNSPLHTKNLS